MKIIVNSIGNTIKYPNEDDNDDIGRQSKQFDSDDFDKKYEDLIKDMDVDKNNDSGNDFDFSNIEETK